MILKKSFVYYVILAYIGVWGFLHSQFLLIGNHFMFLFVFLLAFFLETIQQKTSRLSFWIAAYCFLFPLVASLQSVKIFGQPIFMGIASLRYIWYILFAFVLTRFKYSYYDLISQINKVNICVAIFAIIALYIFGIDHTSIGQYITTTNTIEMGTPMEDAIKGRKLPICSELMVVSYIYYLLSLLKNPKSKKNWLLFGLLMFYCLFVNKSRQAQLSIAIIYIVYYLKVGKFTYKKLLMALIPLILVIGLFVWDPSIISKFTSILDGDNTEDSSTLARIVSITSILPYISQYYLLGVGNLSTQFRDFGFQTFFGQYFYVSDIGIMGTLFRGGILLLVVYFFIYRGLLVRRKHIPSLEIQEYMFYMLILFVLALLLGNDLLSETGSITIAFVFYPLFSKNINSYFYENRRFYNYN